MAKTFVQELNSLIWIFGFCSLVFGLTLGFVVGRYASPYSDRAIQCP